MREFRGHGRESELFEVYITGFMACPESRKEGNVVRIGWSKSESIREHVLLCFPSPLFEIVRFVLVVLNSPANLRAAADATPKIGDRFVLSAVALKRSANLIPAAVSAPRIGCLFARLGVVVLLARLGKDLPMPGSLSPAIT